MCLPHFLIPPINYMPCVITKIHSWSYDLLLTLINLTCHVGLVWFGTINICWSGLPELIHLTLGSAILGRFFFSAPLHPAGLQHAEKSLMDQIWVHMCQLINVQRLGAPSYASCLIRPTSPDSSLVQLIDDFHWVMVETEITLFLEGCSWV
jgi:hypothetical protein